MPLDLARLTILFPLFSKVTFDPCALEPPPKMALKDAVVSPSSSDAPDPPPKTAFDDSVWEPPSNDDPISPPKNDFIDSVLRNPPGGTTAFPLAAPTLSGVEISPSPVMEVGETPSD